MMFAPTKFVPFATTGLFSWPGKIRMGMDLLISPKKVAPGEFNDETLESFVVRRMGRECLDRLAEPLVVVFMHPIQSRCPLLRPSPTP